jgi:peptidoglycan glycosyltransferase
VNRRIGRVFLVLVAGFAVLIGFTSYWQIWAAPSLADRRDNARLVVRELSVDRGTILAANGARLAYSVPSKDLDGRTIYTRRYPAGNTFAQVVGYFSPTANRSGLEDSANDYLTGSTSDLSSFLRNQLHSLTGGTVRGDDVITSLEPPVQRTAMEGLSATHLAGAAVALEVPTGRVLALASWPSYNPNVAASGSTRAWRRVLSRSGAPLLLRATQATYPPGSTFKTVTMTTGLETGVVTPASVIVDPGYFREYGQIIHNAESAPFGAVSMTTALTFSINSVFAQIGTDICHGRAVCPAFTTHMALYGFYSRPPIDLPATQVVPSGIFRIGAPQKLATLTTPLDPARTAIGQWTVRATPLQMAMVAATIGNGGEVMRPTLIDRVRSPSGQLIAQTQPEALGRAISPAVAGQVTSMMEDVVRRGTGVAAAIPGVTVAGKTGTAETGVPGVYDAWFIAFAPAQHPRVAVAVVLEHSRVYGGAIAAPVARQMLVKALAVTH